jgi:hypothetical protein
VVAVAADPLPIVHGVPRVAGVRIARIVLDLIGDDRHLAASQTQHAGDDGVSRLVNRKLPGIVRHGHLYSFRGSGMPSCDRQPSAQSTRSRFVPSRFSVKIRTRRGFHVAVALRVNPDAHSTAGIDLTKWGVAMARKGGVCLNALDLTAFRAHIEARKRSKLRENLGPRASVPSF